MKNEQILWQERTVSNVKVRKFADTRGYIKTQYLVYEWEISIIVFVNVKNDCIESNFLLAAQFSQRYENNIFQTIKFTNMF